VHSFVRFRAYSAKPALSAATFCYPSYKLALAIDITLNTNERSTLL